MRACNRDALPSLGGIGCTRCAAAGSFSQWAATVSENMLFFSAGSGSGNQLIPQAGHRFNREGVDALAEVQVLPFQRRFLLPGLHLPHLPLRNAGLIVRAARQRDKSIPEGGWVSGGISCDGCTFFCKCRFLHAALLITPKE